MKICVIGGANVDITATSAQSFRAADSNPGHVEITWGGVARNIAHNLVLLGDDVELLTIFGGGPFAPLLMASCRTIGIQTGHAEIAPDGINSFFVSINDADGELMGGIADMNAVDGITPQWLEQRQDALHNIDAVVADANNSAETLAWIIDHCDIPLYIDAVSVAKAGRIKQAVELSKKKSFFALKCNALEYPVLESVVAAAQRTYVSMGADGLNIISRGTCRTFPALPCKVNNVTGGGDALLAGIVHAGTTATIDDTARWGLACARCAVESPAAVSEAIQQLRLDL